MHVTINSFEVFRLPSPVFLLPSSFFLLSNVKRPAGGLSPSPSSAATIDKCSVVIRQRSPTSAGRWGVETGDRRWKETRKGEMTEEKKEEKEGKKE